MSFKVNKLGARFSITARGAGVAEFIVIKLAMLAILIGVSESLGADLRYMELGHVASLTYFIAIVFISATLLWDIFSEFRACLD